MTKAAKNAHLAEHKARLADKYQSLAMHSSSKPRSAVWLRASKKYRRQAEQFAAAAKA